MTKSRKVVCKYCGSTDIERYGEIQIDCSQKIEVSETADGTLYYDPVGSIEQDGMPYITGTEFETCLTGFSCACGQQARLIEDLVTSINPELLESGTEVWTNDGVRRVIESIEPDMSHGIRLKLVGETDSLSILQVEPANIVRNGQISLAA